MEKLNTLFFTLMTKGENGELSSSFPTPEDIQPCCVSIALGWLFVLCLECRLGRLPQKHPELLNISYARWYTHTCLTVLSASVAP